MGHQVWKRERHRYSDTDGDIREYNANLYAFLKVKMRKEINIYWRTALGYAPRLWDYAFILPRP